MATDNHTTSTRRSALRFSVAAMLGAMATPARASVPTMAVVAAGATRIAALNKQIYELARRRDEMDLVFIDLRDGPKHEAMDAAFDENFEQLLRLQNEILNLPAQTLEDAAIQAAIGYYRASRLHTFVLSQTTVEEAGQSLCTLHASILLALVKAGRLDIDGIGWGNMRQLCAVSAPGGEV